MRKLLVVALTLSCCGLASGQTWDEIVDGGGDAGELLGTAQIPIGIGPLTTITGFRGPDADLFLINIVDPVAFMASTVANSFGDTQLWLFDVSGFGITFNDDDPSGGGGLLSVITGQFVPGPGEYYLGISNFDYDALNGDDDEIWNDTPFNVERQPDGPGAPGPLANWGGTGGTANAYQIDLVGVEFVPAPGAMALLGLGGLLARRRRRR